MIYFIRAGSHGPVKIGYSLDPNRRLRDLQTSSASDLRLLAIMAGERTHKRAIHSQFREYRMKGEWFAPHESLMAFVRGIPGRRLRHIPKGRIRRYRPIRHQVDDLVMACPRRISSRAIQRGIYTADELRSAIQTGEAYMWPSIGEGSLRLAAAVLGLDLEQYPRWNDPNGRNA